jgi:outer membrane immunogenic protein
VLATLRGRLGRVVGNFAPYLTAGLAVGDIRADVGAFPGNRVWSAGWTVGAGVDIAVARQWTAKFEYLYVDLGNGECTPLTCGGVATIPLHNNIFRAGLHYHFNWPNPVLVRKY